MLPTWEFLDCPPEELREVFDSDPGLEAFFPAASEDGGAAPPLSEKSVVNAKRSAPVYWINPIRSDFIGAELSPQLL